MKNLKACLVVVICALFFLAGVAAADPKPYLVGVFLSLSGDCSDTGSVALKGTELAVDEINAKGGILKRPVKLVVEDSRENDPVNAVTAYRRLALNRDIRLLIGPSCTPAGLAVAPLVAKNPSVIMISPSIGLRQVNEAGDNIFKLWPYDEEGPRLLARYARDQGWKRAAVFSSQQAWEEAQGNFFCDDFKRLGGEIAAKVEPLQSETDFRTAAAQLIATSPDFIMMSNYVRFAPAARSLRMLGYHGPKLSTLMTGDAVKLADGALEGVVSYGYEPSSPGFVARFREKYGKEPWSVGADTAYDALHLYARAVHEAGADSTPLVAKRLLEVRQYEGASGKLSLDSKGGVIKEPVLFRVKDGQIGRL